MADSCSYLYCRGKGISPDHAWMMFYVAHGRKLNTLLQYCSDAREFDADAVYLVYPFLKNHHTFSRLEVHDETGRFVRNLELNPSRYMYFGLHTCLPNQDQILKRCELRGERG